MGSQKKVDSAYLGILHRVASVIYNQGIKSSPPFVSKRGKEAQMEHCLSFKEKTSVPSNTGLVVGIFLHHYLTYYYFSYHMYGWLAPWLARLG